MGGPGGVGGAEARKAVSACCGGGKDPDDGGRVMQLPFQDCGHGVVEGYPVELNLRFLVRPLVALMVGHLGEVAGKVDPDGLAGGAGRIKEIGQDVPCAGGEIRFFGELAGGAGDELFRSRISPASFMGSTATAPGWSM